MKNISTRNELADRLGIPRSKLAFVLYKVGVDNYYKTFDIPKKSKGTRHIAAPTRDLKEIQNSLGKALYEYHESICKKRGTSLNISHAFEKKKSIITNAKIHRNKKFLINIDLNNFFDSFHFGRVRGFFQTNRDYVMSSEVATVIAQLTCYKGKLPQGAPTSPIISNIICQIFDFRVLQIAKKYKLDYTRYADDLSFSTNDKKIIDTWSEFYSLLEKEIINSGFSINHKKTRLQYKDSRQTVTGLVVNKKISVNHDYYKNVRAMANSLYTKGSFTIDGKEGNIKQLEGKFAFINQIDKYNNEIDAELNRGIKHGSRFLCGRERQYQKLLFYRYFFSNEKPLIVTEGKTDIKYIKAALKSLYKEYPELVQKTPNGRFEFNISFLKRSKRMKYFFDFSQDGASPMKMLYGYFSGVGSHKPFNYLEYFLNLTGQYPKNPVIFIFDNEISNKTKPLHDFVNFASINDSDKADLKARLYTKVVKKGNLYVATNPIAPGMKESEIEDLFTSETLGRIINGKRFCRNPDHDNSKFYGKEPFATYIQNNYNTIDFTGFKSFLNVIRDIVSTYDSQVN